MQQAAITLKEACDDVIKSLEAIAARYNTEDDRLFGYYLANLTLIQDKVDSLEKKNEMIQEEKNRVDNELRTKLASIHAKLSQLSNVTGLKMDRHIVNSLRQLRVIPQGSKVDRNSTNGTGSSPENKENDSSSKRKVIINENIISGHPSKGTLSSVIGNTSSKIPSSMKKGVKSIKQSQEISAKPKMMTSTTIKAVTKGTLKRGAKKMDQAPLLKPKMQF